MKIATPLVVLISITIAGVIIIQDWQKIHLSSAGWLIIPTLPGIPIGLLLLSSSYGQIAIILMAVTIISFSIYSLINKTPFELKKDNILMMLSCGFCAGILGGAYGMNGPPLVIYGSMRRWTAQNFRATLQGYFLPASMIAMGGYWRAGLWVPKVTHYYLLSLPIMLPTIFLGRALNQRINKKSFFNYIYLALIVIGLILLLEVL